MRTRIKSSQYRFCATCQVRRVKSRDRQFCSAACVPTSLRQANCRQGRKTYSYRRRALAVKRFLDLLPQRVTREALIDVMWAYGKQCYGNGYRVGIHALGREVSALRDAVEREVA